eukprot:gene18992-6330_t
MVRIFNTGKIIAQRSLWSSNKTKTQDRPDRTMASYGPWSAAVWFPLQPTANNSNKEDCN